MTARFGADIFCIHEQLGFGRQCEAADQSDVVARVLRDQAFGAVAFGRAVAAELVLPAGDDPVFVDPHAAIGRTDIAAAAAEAGEEFLAIVNVVVVDVGVEEAKIVAEVQAWFEKMANLGSDWNASEGAFCARSIRAPDSTRLLYSADRDGNEQPGYVVISADGRVESPVVPAAAGDFRIFGDFAADGSFVYSSTSRNGSDFDIYRATLAGEIERILEGRFSFAAPSVSPDGNWAVVPKRLVRMLTTSTCWRSRQVR